MSGKPPLSLVPFLLLLGGVPSGSPAAAQERATLRGPTDDVYCLSWAPDGKT
jgi:hypothetical protein